MIVLVAQWEWETISSRSIRGIEESARQGNYALPKAPLGYRRNPEDNHKLIIEPEEATIVKKMFEAIAYKDYSLAELRNKLNSERVLNRYWGDAQLNKILSNKIYFGTFSRFGVDYPNHTIPIIDEELFNIVQQRVKATRRQKNQYLYKGLVVCTACKQPMITHCAKGSSGRFYLYYQCQTCGQKQIPENLITRECLPKFEQILKEKSTMTNIEVLKEKYTDMSEVLSNITEAMVRDGIDNELFASLYHLRNKDIKQLDFCIRKLRAGWKNVSFMDLPFHEKREFLLTNVSKIKCDLIYKKVSIELMSEDEEVKMEDSHDENEENSA